MYFRTCRLLRESEAVHRELAEPDSRAQRNTATEAAPQVARRVTDYVHIQLRSKDLFDIVKILRG
jgi:hypothetical protein